MIFQPDQTVYLPDGREAVYVAQYGDAHVVRELRQGFDPEEGYFMYRDDPVTVSEVRTTYPTEDEKHKASGVYLLGLQRPRHCGRHARSPDLARLLGSVGTRAL